MKKALRWMTIASAVAIGFSCWHAEHAIDYIKVLIDEWKSNKQ